MNPITLFLVIACALVGLALGTTVHIFLAHPSSSQRSSSRSRSRWPTLGRSSLSSEPASSRL
jgi:hypothetical protein